MPLGLVVPGLVTRSNGFASYPASPAEVPTFGLSGLGVDSKTPDSSSFLSTSPLLGLRDINGKLATPQQTLPQQSLNMIVCDQPRGFTCRRFSRDGSPDRSESIHGSHGNLSLAEKIQAVLSAIHDAGFDGLESFVSLYYTSDLTSFPNLANARRLSRNRGLPGILVGVRQNIPLWTEWEKQRYKEEVLRSTEAILKTECIELSSSGRLRDLVSIVGQSKEKNPGSILAELSTNLQNEVLGHFRSLRVKPFLELC
ncbi:hypothetical protein K469DRAFT_686553 [Zopfia rhizophila CBS 207.26]|uniref:Uncharacterized protein n=1 Tax=Zopfia rhizophila CBS 207.26 TaxID=1314779 RepID=A0A6A6ESI8_9PEZI|nr:hypothetical protein K469DRAFT_686553 [Zopfia rhizophila CBS 207.26]